MRAKESNFAGENQKKNEDDSYDLTNDILQTYELMNR